MHCHFQKAFGKAVPRWFLCLMTMNISFASIDQEHRSKKYVLRSYMALSNMMAREKLE